MSKVDGSTEYQQLSTMWNDSEVTALLVVHLLLYGQYDWPNRQVKQKNPCELFFEFESSGWWGSASNFVGALPNCAHAENHFRLSNDFFHIANWKQSLFFYAQLFHIILLHIQATGNTTFKYTPVSTLCCVITKLAKPKWGYVFVLSSNTRIIYTPDDFNIKHSTFHVGALCLLLDKLNNTDNGEGFYCKDNYFITCVCLVREIMSEKGNWWYLQEEAHRGLGWLFLRRLLWEGELLLGSQGDSGGGGGKEGLEAELPLCFSASRCMEK